MYKCEATDRAKIRKELITVRDQPCFICGSKENREIHRLQNGRDGGQYTRDNCTVRCTKCHDKDHTNSKFKVGAKVSLNKRTPLYLGLTAELKTSPRTITSIYYDQDKACNFYKLGSNARGWSAHNGNPLEGLEYEFRSYQLIPYIPRRYHFKRHYQIRTAKTRDINNNKDIQNNLSGQ